MANHGKKVYELEDGTLLNYKTGEVLENVEIAYVRTEKQIEQIKKYYERRSEQEEKNKNYPKINNPFIWQYYTERKNIFKDLNPQDIARLTFIATYCEYNTNALINGKTYLKKNDIFNLVKISKTQFKEWYSKMINLEYLKEKNEKIILNKKFFNKGSMMKENNATRIFTDIVRKLYSNIEPKDHYKVGYILQLVPYINPYFNILATNPKEQDKNKLQRLKMSDLADILGVDKKNIRRLANELLSLSFGEEKTPLIGLLALRSLDVGKMFIIMNTKLVFGGNLNQYKEIEELFNNRMLEIGTGDYYEDD